MQRKSIHNQFDDMLGAVCKSDYVCVPVFVPKADSVVGYGSLWKRGAILTVALLFVSGEETVHVAVKIS